MKAKTLALITLWGILSVLSVDGQEQRSEDKASNWWVNIPSSPLKFEAAPNGEHYLLGNYSGGRVVRYRSGCVEWYGGRLKIVKGGELLYTNLDPIDLMFDARSQTTYRVNAMHSGGTHGLHVARCAMGTKTAIIEVVFEDGGSWKAK